MADRLQELLQQRALIREHLAWLDEQIADAGHTAPPADVPRNTGVPFLRIHQPLATAQPAPAPAPVTTPQQHRTEADAEELLRKFASERQEKMLPNRTGCWMFFSVALFAIVLAAWLISRHFNA